MTIADDVMRHKASPNISTEDYTRRMRIKLAREIATAKKVYLDTKFWLLIRDGHLGRGDACNVELLNLLRTLAASNRIVCPISATTFIEIFAQTDPVTLETSVKLIDELSKGVSLIEQGERFQLELLHFMLKYTRGDSGLDPLKDMVWTKSPYVLGFSIPSSKALSAEGNRMLQKAFVDHLWTLGLLDMYRTMGENVKRFPRTVVDISDKLNEGKFAHLDQNASFEQTFISEIGGIVDVYKPMLADLMCHLYFLDHGVRPGPGDGIGEFGRVAANLIFHAFRLNKIKNDLPSLRVSAGLHAALRWDKGRKYKKNDFHDFHHAVAAVPYCDYFLTEHSLRNLLGHKRLKFGELFSCQTISSVPETIESLSRLAA